MGESFIKPFGAKAWTFASRPPEKDKFITVMEGAIRSGKTFSLHPKIIAHLCRYNVRGLKVLIGVSKQTVKDNLLNDLFNIIGEDNYHYNVQSGELTLFESKWLVIGAKDEGSEKYLRGKTIGVAIVEEGTLIPRNFFMQLIGRLSSKGSRLYVNTNPDMPTHYLYTEIMTNPTMTDRVEVIHFDLDDNPNLSPETIANYRAAFTGVFYQRFILGLWVAAEGAIYGSSWAGDPTVAPGQPGAENLYDDLTRPIGLRNSHADRWVSVDCGTDHPQVYYEFLDDGTKLWCENEYVWDSRVTYKQKTDKEYADDLVEFMERGGGACLIVVPPECASFKAELATRGLWYTDADNEVLDGIRVVSSMLYQRKLRIHKDNCPRLVKAIPSYVWDKKAGERSGEDKPLKVADDECDSFRYGVKGRIPEWRISA